MAIDFELLNQVLSNSKNKYKNTNKQSFSTSFWKPQPGVQVVRIVPYKYNTTKIPFIPYSFYFFMMPEIKRPFLAPSFYNHPDPIKEAQSVLFASGDPADIEIAKKMNESKRFYTAVIVRGREHDGIKLWGCSYTVATEISDIMRGEHGDITDLNNGYDLTVECFPRGVRGRYPVTTVKASIKSSLAFDPNDATMQNLFQNPPNINDIFKEPTYDELKEAVNKWLHPDAGSESFNNPSANTFTTVNEQKNTNPFLQNTVKTNPQTGFVQQAPAPSNQSFGGFNTPNPFTQPTPAAQPVAFAQTQAFTPQPVNQVQQPAQQAQSTAQSYQTSGDDINDQLKEMFGIQ